MNKDRAAQVKAALSNVLKQKGQSQQKLGLLMLQVAHETGGFNSPVSDTNNMSGIKYVPDNNFMATRGRKSPEGDYYASYPSIEHWAKQYYYEITKKSNPLAATTIEEFARRLKANGYFGATLDSYTNALKSWKNQITKITGIPFDTNTTQITILISLLIVIIIL